MKTKSLTFKSTLLSNVSPHCMRNYSGDMTTFEWLLTELKLCLSLQLKRPHWAILGVSCFYGGVNGFVNVLLTLIAQTYFTPHTMSYLYTNVLQGFI